MNITLIHQQKIDVKLDALARAMIAEVGLSSPVASFHFVEETGDLMEHEDSYIELADGRCLPVTYDLIEKAAQTLCAELISRGLTINDMVIRNWRKHPRLVPGSDSAFSIHLENLPNKVPTAKPEYLAAIVTEYFQNLPVDFNRAVLNRLPSPSIWPAIVHRLLTRDGYPYLVATVCLIANEISEDIAVLICCEAIRGRKAAKIKGASAMHDFEQAMPADPHQARVWGENLLSLMMAKED